MSEPGQKKPIVEGVGDVGTIASILVLIGGILLVLFSLISLVKGGVGSILGLVTGIIAIIEYKNAAILVWAIIFIVLGYLSGGAGGILVLVGGLIGLAVYLVQHR